MKNYYKMIDFTVEQLEGAARMLKAMAHPVRVQIIKMLEGKKLNVTEIYESLNLEQSVVSHHLGILRDKGIVVAKREGKNVFYSLKDEIITSVIECLTKCSQK